jgi:hypothetical protein
MAIISVGAWNKFGHPAPEILARLADGARRSTEQIAVAQSICRSTQMVHGVWNK